MRMLAMGATTVALTFAINIDIASAQIVDGPTVEWRHSNWGKRRANTEGIEKINAILKERTGGKFTIKIGYGEMFSKDKENLELDQAQRHRDGGHVQLLPSGQEPGLDGVLAALPALREPGGER